jgi:hypothetical protein
MLSFSSRCFGQVDACDSKREYLFSMAWRGLKPSVPFPWRGGEEGGWGKRGSVVGVEEAACRR